MPNKEKHVVVERDVDDADADALRKYYKSLAEACRGIIKRNEDLEKENARLKKLVADLSLDNSILKEAARGNF